MLQKEAIIKMKVTEDRKTEKKNRYAASNIRILCRNCFTDVASGDDFRLLENSHYVNINPGFK